MGRGRFALLALSAVLAKRVLRRYAKFLASAQTDANFPFISSPLRSGFCRALTSGQKIWRTPAWCFGDVAKPIAFHSRNLKGI